MVALAQLLDQGVSYAEIQERAQDDVQLEQELIWLQLKGMEPNNDDTLARPDMWPGRIERCHRAKSYHHGPGRAAISHRKHSAPGRVHRPWRELSQSWPEHRHVVEVQIRGAGPNGSNRLYGCYHVNKQWYDKEGRRISSVVERWRPMPER